MAEESTGGAGDTTYTQSELEAKIQEANAGLEANRDKILEELKTVKANLRKYDGVDPDEIKQLREQLSELQEQSKAEKAGLTGEDLAKLRADVEKNLIERFAKDRDLGLQTFDWARELATENRGLKLDTKVKAEMAKGGARSERIDALFRLTEDRFSLTDDGQPMLKDNPGLEIGEYVASTLKQEYPEFYNGSGSTGGGASKSNAGGVGTKTIARDDQAAFLANVDKIASGEIEVEPA